MKWFIIIPLLFNPGQYSTVEVADEATCDNLAAQYELAGFSGVECVTNQPTFEQDFTIATILTSLDGRPVAESARLLLTTTARASQTDFAWNPDRKTVRNWGRAPTVIEPVTGTVWLLALRNAKALTFQPLTAEGRPLGEPVRAELTNLGFRVPVGDPPATWYVAEVGR